jgi:long-subunit acyl-CoA synthetase (AMP-forming)
MVRIRTVWLIPMSVLLEIVAEVFCLLAEPCVEWIVRACAGVWQAIVEVIRYRQLEREERDRGG